MLVSCVPNYDQKNEDTALRNLVRVCALEQALSEGNVKFIINKIVVITFNKYFKNVLSIYSDDVLNSMLMPMHSPGNCVMACMWAQLELVIIQNFFFFNKVFY